MIHDEHPFREPPDERDPVRQFRGRLVAPVTVVTATAQDGPTGLTVSSLMVAEGEPASLVVLVGAATDLWGAIEWSERFVVHILDASRREHADVFAGIRPQPGGMFSGLNVEETEWGPVLADFPNRAYCRLGTTTELPFHHLVEGVIDHVEIGDLTDPAIYFRGAYRHLEKR